MRRLGLSLVLVLFSFAAAAVTALHFPALTDRVVDGAHILSPQAIQELDQKLADYEHGTSNQVVVVTLPSLQGTSIEDYGYQLGRKWAIGQKGKNNGVLLIVAPTEHKVRIEVGYGNEPTLTDAASSEIVNGIILPAFRSHEMERGIVEGTEAILNVLGGESHSTVVHYDSSHMQHYYNYNYGEAARPTPPLETFLLIVFAIIVLMLFVRYPSFMFNLLFNMLFNSVFRSGNSSFGGGSGGGGFSGGGGSFGGGGASGSW